MIGRIAAGFLAGLAVAAVLWAWAGPPAAAVIARPSPPVRILLWVSPVRAAPEAAPVK